MRIKKHFCRNNAFKEDEGAWKGEGDGKVVNNQPQRVMMDGQQMMPSGYIGKWVIMQYLWVEQINKTAI